MRVLYLSYDGMLEPLGQSQVQQYLLRLAERHQIWLVSFEKPADLADEERMAAQQSRFEGAGIKWMPLRYHRRFTLVATLYDVLRGTLLGIRVARRERIQVVHARSYVAALVGEFVKRFSGARLIFDMRGFWADERIDGAGEASASAVYRTLKRLERHLLTTADAVVSLTHAAVDVMKRFPFLKERDVRFRVIPTCTNHALFTPPAEVPPETPLTIGYVGSVASFYRFDRVLDAFDALARQHPEVRFLIVNKGQHGFIREQLALHPGLNERVDLKEVAFENVAREMQRMHAAVFFVKATFSKIASAPTRLGEFLACGVPCLVNDGVGDMGSIVRDRGVGVVIDVEADAVAMERAVAELVERSRQPEVRARCVDASRDIFSLDAGVAAYDALYETLGTV